jgi:hypothetical protein
LERQQLQHKGEAGGGGSSSSSGEELSFAPFPSSFSVRGVLLSASNGLGLGLSDLGWA